MSARPAPPRTIRELLAVSVDWLKQRGVASARLDAELLLGHALHESRLQLYMDLDRPLSDEERDRFRPLLARRGRQEPVAYILGEKEFYGLSMSVTPAVLVPRPDTETLVDLALERLPADESGVVIDLCTGSGCVAVALAHERPSLRVIATDLSAEALQVAAENVRRHGVSERVTLRQGDALAPVHDVSGAKLVVGNPPYIKPADEAGLMPDVREHEPRLALIGDDDDGLGVHRRILAGARALLADGGALLLESGFDQGEGLLALPHPGFSAAELYRDLAGHVRGALWRARAGDAEEPD